MEKLQKRTAKIMKSQGIDIETIKQATGLSEEEIKKL
jgi:predicted transposase YdaD